MQRRFNSRPRTTGDDEYQPDCIVIDVSIHARARRATSTREAQSFARVFQFTPAHDGRHCPHRPHLLLILFQFTPAHDGRLGFGLAGLNSMFQFTPAHDGRRGRARERDRGVSFNSRPRTTGDLDRALLDRAHVVSIHARARRATSREKLYGGKIVVSIHARARRATAVLDHHDIPDRFQFTPAHDGRLSGMSTLTIRTRFNSRPRTTGDP